jgi:CRP-like cAMP-binding protein
MDDKVAAKALWAVRLLNQRLSSSSVPVSDKASVIVDKNSASRAVRRGEEIVRAGRRSDSIFLISEGMAIRYRILRDGQRQILNLLLPGDLVGITGCRFAKAPYSTKFLTNGAVASIPVSRLMTLLNTHPRIVAELLWNFTSDTVLGERLVAVSRRTAKERVAHFLLDLFKRLQDIKLADERSFRMPLTQEMISDTLGLSVPYVNRVLHELRDDGLVRIRGRLVIIEDLDRLSALADFEPGYLRPLSITELLRELA